MLGKGWKAKKHIPYLWSLQLDEKAKDPLWLDEIEAVVKSQSANSVVQRSDSKQSDRKSSQGTQTWMSSSGFIVSSVGHVLTTLHGVKDCEGIVGFLKDNVMKLMLVNSDPSNDLALLLVGTTESFRQAVFRQAPSPRLGESVVTVGFPLQSVIGYTQRNVTTGVISALAGFDNDSRFYQISAPVQQGNSGGPLLDRSGHVIGMIVSKLSALQVAGLTGDIPQNINFAIKTSIVRNFLEANGVSFSITSSESEESIPDIGEQTADYTMALYCAR
ncbi:MAG: hypothetical protein NPIRA04_20480 [Nitrospirales bacterium]|nr:MAG: hypothetical protein NPIRA04_20480 [Nitrospirales bacterium]